MDQSGTDVNKLIAHLFRHEYGKLVSILTRVFGATNIELAEDVVHDALLEALNIWNYKGIPSNPTAWIYTVAKNKAINILKNKKYKKTFSLIDVNISGKQASDEMLDEFFNEKNISDDLLRMIFICCHPALSQDSQVALILKTLCGFSIPEIARAFITASETINKRLVRARQKIREAELPFQLPGKNEINKRLDSVIETVYLIFNEGYSATAGDEIINYDQCEEAIRLSEMLVENKLVEDKSKIYALLSLMLFNIARFNARIGINGGIIGLAEQDRSRWNKNIIKKGLYFLQKSTESETISKYHIMAVISAHHCSAPDFKSTDWKSILSLYDSLLEVDNSPVVILNRAVALSEVLGIDAAIEELEKLMHNNSLASYHLFYATLAELYIQAKSFDKAVDNLRKAVSITENRQEKDWLNRKLKKCENLLINF